MFEFISYNPVRAIFGIGKVNLAGEKAAELGRKALLVSYREPGALRPLLERIKGLLEKAGLAVVEFYAFEENPTIVTAAEGVALARQAGCDVVVAVRSLEHGVPSPRWLGETDRPARQSPAAAGHPDLAGHRQRDEHVRRADQSRAQGEILHLGRVPLPPHCHSGSGADRFLAGPAVRLRRRGHDFARAGNLHQLAHGHAPASARDDE